MDYITFSRLHSFATIKTLFNKNAGYISPKLLYAQAKHETANFTSVNYKENKNFFGIKLAKKRPTTAIGEDKKGIKYAIYKNYTDSIIDAFLRVGQNKKYNKIKSSYIDDKNEFFSYLQNTGYAEDKDYINLLNKYLK